MRKFWSIFQLLQYRELFSKTALYDYYLHQDFCYDYKREQKQKAKKIAKNISILQ